MGEVRDNIAHRGNSEMTSGRNNLYCTYCKRTNHVRGNCYRLIGYPQDFKFTKGKKNFSNAKANAVEANEHLILYHQFQETLCPSLLTLKASQKSNDLFTVRINRKFGDCAAGLYMLKDNTSIANNSIKFSNIQSLKFSPKCSLKSENVVSKFQSLCVVPEPVLTPPLSTFDHMNGKNYVSENPESIKLWHLRLGHMSYNAMKNIARILVSHEKHRFPCDVCPMARQSKLPFPKISISSKHCFELLHINTWGPYKTPTHKGERYFFTIVDDFSRAT
ncbi:hypothetical protein KY284_020422 [Solanum tuberosum]|nr:hypothetical protein KY284_020422 [Solanum tuberosum]